MRKYVAIDIFFLNYFVTPATFCSFQYTSRVTHETVLLKIERDVDDTKYISAKIFCCLCNDTSNVRQYGRRKKNGEKGTDRWILSNYETHLRSKHVGKMLSTRSLSEPNMLLKLLGKGEGEGKGVISEKTSNDLANDADDVILGSASGECISRKRQERVLLEKKSSSKMSPEADGIEIKDVDIDQ